MNNLIISTLKKINNNYNFNYFNNYIDYFKKNKIEKKLKENIYELNGFIQYLNQNKNINIGIKFNLENENNYYRIIKLDNIEFKNYLMTLISNNFIIDRKKILEKKKDKNIVLYIIVNSNNYDIYPKEINYSSLTTLLGIENINILKHINYSNFIKIKNNSDSFKKLIDYNNILLKYNDNIQYLSCIMSSMVLFIIGCTSAEDVDLLIYNKYNYNLVNSLSKKLDNNTKYKIDYSRLDNNNLWYVSAKKKYLYWMNYAISNEWIKKVNLSNIEDLFFDCKNHFYIFNIKFISLDLQFYRMYKRNSVNSFVDILGLKYYNNYIKEYPIIISKVKSRSGKITLIDNKEYNNMIIDIQKKLKVWYSINISLKELKKIYVFEEGKSYNQYERTKSTYGLFKNLRNFHQSIKVKYLKEYCNNCDYIIDIGSSDLKNIRFWKNLSIKHIFAFEPSESLYKLGIEKQKKNKFASKKITFIKAPGEENWNDLLLNNNFKNKFLKMKNIKADCITFEFTIHYMFYNLDTLFKNIIKYCKKNTKIIIHTMNYNVVSQKLLNNNKYIIKKNNQDVFYIEKLYKNNDQFKKINVFFKGASGLNNIVSEYLVDNEQLINSFKNNNFELTYNSKFLDNYNKEFNLDDYELKVSELYITYLFNYIG